VAAEAGFFAGDFAGAFAGALAGAGAFAATGAFFAGAGFIAAGAAAELLAVASIGFFTPSQPAVRASLCQFVYGKQVVCFLLSVVSTTNQPYQPTFILASELINQPSIA